MGLFDAVIIETTNEQEGAQRETILCSNCRMVCDARLNFCGRCGQRLRGAHLAMRTVPLAPSTPLPMIAQPQQRTSLSFLIMLGVCILSICFALVTGIFAFTRSATSRTSAAPHVYAPLSISKPEGSVWFYNVHGQGDGVALHLSALPKLTSGMVYVVWLINPLRPDQFLAVGPIIPDSHGEALLQSDRLPVFNTQGQNLRQIFTHVAVTLEKVGAQWVRPTGSPLLQGVLDQAAQANILPLFTRSPYTPNQIALVPGLQSQTHELARWLTNMLDVQQHNQAGSVHTDLLRFIYLLEGSHGADVARLHLTSQQSVTSVGDGVGLLSTNEANCQRDSHQCGYLDLIDATVQTLMTRNFVPQPSAQHVLTALATMYQLAQNIQQEANNLTPLSKLDTPTLHALTMLEVQTDALLNGTDLDGDGNIDAVPGEAATAQLYAYVQQLGAIQLS